MIKYGLTLKLITISSIAVSGASNNFLSMAPTLRSLMVNKRTPQIVARAYSVKNGDEGSVESQASVRDSYFELIKEQRFLENCKDEARFAKLVDEERAIIIEKLNKDIKIIKEKRKTILLKIIESKSNQKWILEMITTESEVDLIKEKIMAANNETILADLMKLQLLQRRLDTLHSIIGGGL